MDEIQKLKKRLGMAEKALMRIDSIFNDSDRPSQIVSEYFEKVNEWWFDTENTSHNSDYEKCPKCGSIKREQYTKSEDRCLDCGNIYPYYL